MRDIARREMGSIFAQHPSIQPAEFRSMLLARIERVKNIAEKYLRGKQPLIEKLANGSNIFAAIENHNSGLSFDAKIRAFKLNALFMNAWRSKQQIPIGKNHALVFNIFRHPESPISITIIKKNPGKFLANVGGLLSYSVSGQPVLNVLTLEGEKIRGINQIPEPRRSEILGRHIGDYHALSRELGRGWRAFFVSEAKKIAERKGLELIVEVPSRERNDYLRHISDAEYHRIRAEYTRAAEKAGLHPTGAHRYSNRSKPK